LKRAFLICPVRNGVPIEAENAVKDLESKGYIVHFPPRDTNQEDETGYRICSDNRSAMESANIVAVVWDGKSQGGLFDLGMAFALRKPVLVYMLPEPSIGKSFQNMIRFWEEYIPVQQLTNGKES
jgi:nucleoside 2-deoxyribosyltransferase